MAVRLYNKAVDGRWIMKLEASFDTSNKVISAEADAAMEKIHSSLKNISTWDEFKAYVSGLEKGESFYNDLVNCLVSIQEGIQDEIDQGLWSESELLQLIGELRGSRLVRGLDKLDTRLYGLTNPYKLCF